MALNTAAQITAYFCTIYEDAMFVAREAAVMPALVTSFSNSTNENVGRSASVYNSATIADIGETDDLQSQSFTPSVLSTLTPAEKGGWWCGLACASRFRRRCGRCRWFGCPVVNGSWFVCHFNP